MSPYILSWIHPVVDSRIDSLFIWNSVWPLNREIAKNFIHPGKPRNFSQKSLYRSQCTKRIFKNLYFLFVYNVLSIYHGPSPNNIDPMCMENIINFIIIWYSLFVLFIRTGAITFRSPILVLVHYGYGVPTRSTLHPSFVLHLSLSCGSGGTFRYPSLPHDKVSIFRVMML